MSTQQGRVYSINISDQKGVAKKPVSTANLITDYGLEGDVHAGDKIKQVSLLSLESIKQQKECPKIKNKSLELKPGDFAENITTEGIDLAKIKEGDRMRVGKEVLLEVTKIGKECYRRCSIYYKIGDCIMPREGVFARVLKGGVIQSGDVLEITPRAAIVTISDSCFKKERKDESGKTLADLLKKRGIELVASEIIPDEKELIKEKLKEHSDILKVDLIFTSGGTGLGPRDVTPEATLEVADRIVPGIAEMIRNENITRTGKRSVLSRAVSVIRKGTLIINLPGSPAGVKESFEAIAEILGHAVEMLRGGGH